MPTRGPWLLMVLFRETFGIETKNLCEVPNASMNSLLSVDHRAVSLPGGPSKNGLSKWLKWSEMLVLATHPSIVRFWHMPHADIKE
jgi:hypothetical protein